MHDRVIQLRKERGLRQKDVYEALKMDGSQYSKFEKGERGLTILQLADISKLLGVSTDYLIFGVDKNSKTKTPPGASTEGGNKVELEAEDIMSLLREIKSDQKRIAVSLENILPPGEIAQGRQLDESELIDAAKRAAKLREKLRGSSNENLPEPQKKDSRKG